MALPARQPEGCVLRNRPLNSCSVHPPRSLTWVARSPSCSFARSSTRSGSGRRSRRRTSRSPCSAVSSRCYAAYDFFHFDARVPGPWPARARHGFVTRPTGAHSHRPDKVATVARSGLPPVQPVERSACTPLGPHHRRHQDGGQRLEPGGPHPRAGGEALAEAIATDQEEDARYGAARGNEFPLSWPTRGHVGPGSPRPRHTWTNKTPCAKPSTNNAWPPRPSATRRVRPGAEDGRSSPGTQSLSPRSTSRAPTAIVADAGYWSPESAAAAGGPELFIATRTKRVRAQAPLPSTGRFRASATPLQLMERRLAARRGRAVYAKRGMTVEPAFGQIKEVRRARRFQRRGLGAVGCEQKLLATPTTS